MDGNWRYSYIEHQLNDILNFQYEIKSNNLIFVIIIFILVRIYEGNGYWQSLTHFLLANDMLPFQIPLVRHIVGLVPIGYNLSLLSTPIIFAFFSFTFSLLAASVTRRHLSWSLFFPYPEPKAPFRLSIRTMDVTVKHYFPPSPPMRLLSFLLSSARPSAKSVKGSRGLIWLIAISHTHNSMVTFLLFYWLNLN